MRCRTLRNSSNIKLNGRRNLLEDEEAVLRFFDADDFLINTNLSARPKRETDEEKIPNQKIIPYKVA